MFSLYIFNLAIKKPFVSSLSLRRRSPIRSMQFRFSIKISQLFWSHNFIFRSPFTVCWSLYFYSLFLTSTCIGHGFDVRTIFNSIQNLYESIHISVILNCFFLIFGSCFFYSFWPFYNVSCEHCMYYCRSCVIHHNRMGSVILELLMCILYLFNDKPILFCAVFVIFFLFLHQKIIKSATVTTFKPNYLFIYTRIKKKEKL